jgi:hypothetical protein
MDSIQPDLQIRNDDDSLYTGDGIYNDVNAQTKSQIAGSGMTLIYGIKLVNDRVAVDCFNLTASQPNADWGVNLYDLSNNADITADITGSG